MLGLGATARREAPGFKGRLVSGPVDPRTVELLTSPQGWSLLAALPHYEEGAALHLGEALREEGYAPDLVAAALTQSRLRARGAGKLGPFAEGMLLTPDGLEQATRLEVAARHAERFRAAGVEHVWDLGCGIGADAMAFAALGLRVSAVDADPATALIARVNLRHFDDADARVADAEEVAEQIADQVAGQIADQVAERPATQTAGPLTADAARVGVWFDPARRLPGATDATGRTRRTFRLDALSPSWRTVLFTAARVPATGAKLSPSLPESALAEASAAAGPVEAQWTSYAGEVLECALWFGPLASRPGRSALVLRPGDRPGAPAVAWEIREPEDAARRSPRDAAPVDGRLPREGQWWYDPDRAVVRARLVGVLASLTGGVEVAPGAGYVVSEAAVEVPWARRYVVLAALPLQVKPLRAWLRARGVGRLVIKKRGVDVDPDRLRRDLRLSGEGEELTCVLTSLAGRRIFVAVTPA